MESPKDWPFDATTDLGRAYLAVDWSATDLGPVEAWSDSLRSTVRLMLSSRFSMWMGWGPQLRFFCNEAYRRDTLAGKYPWALGRPTQEVWSEIWDDISDRIAAVTVGGESTWDEELQLYVQRSGYLEETFHTFSYFPLTEGDSSIVGLMCVVSEVTDGVVNARRIATLGNLTAGLAAAATEREVSVAARDGVDANPVDFPFAAAYVDDPQDGTCRLAWSSGLPAGTPATPEVHGGVGAPWSPGSSADQVVVVDEVGRLLADLAPDPQGSRPTRAVIAPVTGTRGFLVVAASPHRPLDEQYIGFVQLVADQYGAALLRARAIEAERDQAILMAARERAIARDLQSSLIPTTDFDTDHLDIATYYRAGVDGTEVGGDWYDVIDLGPGRTALVIGDVRGRGVRAAAVMGQLRAAVRAYARLELAPDVVLGLLDETVRELAENRTATCVYAVYDPAEHTLAYANAGHPRPLLTLPGQATQELAGVGAPLGAGRAWPTLHTVTLPVGATLSMFTDGLVDRDEAQAEAEAEADDRIRRLIGALNTESTPVDDIPDHLVAHLLPDGPDDDLALLIAQVSRRAHLDHSARLPLDQDARNVSIARTFITETLRRWRIDEDTAFDAQVVVSELITNAFVHAHSEAVLTVRTTGTRLFLEVHDTVATAPRPRNALPSDTNGRGLAIVATLATRWGTRQTTDGKAVWCELRLATSDDEQAAS